MEYVRIHQTKFVDIPYKADSEQLFYKLHNIYSAITEKHFLSMIFLLETH